MTTKKMKLCTFKVTVWALGEWTDERAEDFLANNAPALKVYLEHAGKQVELYGALKVEVEDE